MFNNKLVASLKANGKILREFKDTVYIPFGSEYSFLIKNLNISRAVVNIFIDGDDVVEGGLVLNAGQSVDLERYVRANNLTSGNKFKFIERTSKIEDHRGVKLEDGLIRIEFQFEAPLYQYTALRGGSLPFRNETYSLLGSAVAQNCSQSQISASASAAVPVNDIGITVPGSKSDQAFTSTYLGQLDPEKHSIVFRLLGETEDNKVVTRPVTVNTKPRCVTCDTRNNSTAKFCSNCGTSLVLF